MTHSYYNKPFEELDVLDNFLMNAVAANSEVGEAFCRKVLSVLLQRRIGKIKIVAQYTLPAHSPGYRGIRMDVKVEEPADTKEALPANVYDLEPHLRNDLDLPRHNRFYQAKIDSSHMKRGDNDFSHMPDLYIITILNFDPFGYDYMMYTIENRCTEVGELRYKDGLKFIYFYTGGTKGGSREIKTMLQYLQHSTDDNAIDEATREIHRYVSQVRVLPEIREDYMRFEEFIYYERKDAAKETIRNNILDLLEDYGEIPSWLKEKLEAVNDADLLRKYHKLAARAGSLEAFMEKMK
ncbi:MAG: hypothetical protein HDR26_00225 [Lachnospiraceae bacterium]|nr:hypothetical protein [Lachnospiraceae bacterium]